MRPEATSAQHAPSREEAQRRARNVLDGRLEHMRLELDRILDLLDAGHVEAVSRYLHTALRHTERVLERFDNAHCIAPSDGGS